MSRSLKRVAVAALTFISIVGVVATAAKPAEADNVCYANGTSYTEGQTACMGGWTMVCANGGWSVLGEGHRC